MFQWCFSGITEFCQCRPAVINGLQYGAWWFCSYIIMCNTFIQNILPFIHGDCKYLGVPAFWSAVYHIWMLAVSCKADYKRNTSQFSEKIRDINMFGGLFSAVPFVLPSLLDLTKGRHNRVILIDVHNRGAFSPILALLCFPHHPTLPNKNTNLKRRDSEKKKKKKKRKKASLGACTLSILLLQSIKLWNLDKDIGVGWRLGCPRSSVPRSPLAGWHRE